MRPFEQEFLHDANAGVMGDCYRACLATILSQWEPDITLADVPHFAALYGKEMMHHAVQWVTERGYFIAEERLDAYSSVPTQKTAWERLREAMEGDRGYIVSGASPRFLDMQHAVVMRGTRLFHDPHPTRLGIYTAQWFTFVEPLSAP